jgi:hemolysin activation/secretion protein
MWGTFGLTQMSATMAFGALDIEDATAFAADAVGPQTQGRYGKLVVRASRAMKLPNDLSVTLQLRMQQSLDNKNLDSSERMGVSGSGGVMAYPLGELSGSNARFGSIEIARPLPEIEALSNLNHNWSAFAEWGRAGEADPINSSDNMRSISGIGLSWSGTWENVTAKVYLTHRLEAASPITEPSSRTSVAAEIGMLF